MDKTLQNTDFACLNFLFEDNYGRAGIETDLEMCVLAPQRSCWRLITEQAVRAHVVHPDWDHMTKWLCSSTWNLVIKFPTLTQHINCNTEMNPKRLSSVQASASYRNCIKTAILKGSDPDAFTQLENVKLKMQIIIFISFNRTKEGKEKNLKTVEMALS